MDISLPFDICRKAVSIEAASLVVLPVDSRSHSARHLKDASSALSPFTEIVLLCMMGMAKPLALLEFMDAMVVDSVTDAGSGACNGIGESDRFDVPSLSRPSPQKEVDPGIG